MQIATVIDVAAALKILAAALIVGVGVTAMYGQGARGAENIARARRGEDHGGPVVLDALLVGATALVCIAALVVGFIAMTHK